MNLNVKINELQQANFIEPSNSEYSSPPMFVPKKKIGDKLEWRLCIDYKRIKQKYDKR